MNINDYILIILKFKYTDVYLKSKQGKKTKGKNI